MQPLTWYLRRLRCMSPAELAWRSRSAVRDAVDRCRLALGYYPSPTAILALDGGGFPEPGFRVADVRVGEWAKLDLRAVEFPWYARLIDQADRAARNRFTFFALEDRDLGDPIDWNRDHESGQAAQLGFAPSIDYRDHRIAGDAKVVWEPNRHHQLVVLGRAYRASGDPRFAAAVVSQVDSWLEQCPFGMGMNWRSPLELAIRLINWVWAMDLIRESGLVTGAFRVRWLQAAHLHLWEITRKYSRGSAANNHRIGEAAGVFIATSYLRQLGDAPRWRAESWKILAEEIIVQTYPDGGTRELALGYHLFVLELCLLAGLVARQTGEDYPSTYWMRLEKMLEFAGALTEGGDGLPMFGDSDDGHVLDLGIGHGDARGLLATGAVLFGRSDFKEWAGSYREPARWLLGRGSHAQFSAIPSAPAADSLVSRALPDSGFYLLQCGRRAGADRVSVVFDCGELGFGSIAAHGHADALSFTLRAFGTDVFVDPGTYDYFTSPTWRDYFRGTRAHNTVVIDDTDQSVMLGPFLWGDRARARCTLWAPAPQGGIVAGIHDGYTRLADPAVHYRRLELDGPARVLTIHDEIKTRGAHQVAIYFHLGKACVLSELGHHRYAIGARNGQVVLEVDPRLSVSLLNGSEAPLGGWVSDGYHRKAPSTTLVGRGTCRGDTALVCRVEIDLPVESGPETGRASGMWRTDLSATRMALAPKTPRDSSPGPESNSEGGGIDFFTGSDGGPRHTPDSNYLDGSEGLTASWSTSVAGRPSALPKVANEG